MYPSSRGPMPFLPIMDVWIADEALKQQVLPPTINNEAPIELVLPDGLDSQGAFEAQDFSLDSVLKIKPFVIEGSVENFDPVGRAIGLAKSFPRKWCGTYSSFDDNSNEIDVLLTFSNPSSTGQIVDLKGEMLIGDISTPIQGYLNAKSDQLELFLLSEKLIYGLEPGGVFVGLHNAKLLGWKPPRLDQPGGRLVLREDCDNQALKAPSLITIW